MSLVNFYNERLFNSLIGQKICKKYWPKNAYIEVKYLGDEKIFGKLFWKVWCGSSMEVAVNIEELPGDEWLYYKDDNWRFADWIKKTLEEKHLSYIEKLIPSKKKHKHNWTYITTRNEKGEVKNFRQCEICLIEE